MTRIFSTLAAISLLGLGVAFWLGWQFGDASSPANAQRFAVHFLFGFVALTFSTLVHSFVLTYFIGTGRWMEETVFAYQLPEEWLLTSKRVKWRLLPLMMLALLSLILTGAAGGAADPASTVRFSGWAGLSPGEIHAWVSGVTIALNVGVTGLEFWALFRNGRLIEQVVAEVRRIRLARGLAVDS